MSISVLGVVCCSIKAAGWGLRKLSTFNQRISYGIVVRRGITFSDEPSELWGILGIGDVKLGEETSLI
jgi:hypothetical protein